MASPSGIEFGCRTIWFDLIGIGNLANLKTKNHISNFKAAKIFAHVWSENWEMQKWKFPALVFWCLVILIKMSNLTHFHDKVKWISTELTNNKNSENVIPFADPIRFCKNDFLSCSVGKVKKIEIFFRKQFEISKSFWVERFSQCALWSRGMEESFLREFPVLRENGGIVCLSKSFFRIWWNLEDLIKSYQIFIFIWIPSTDR